MPGADFSVSIQKKKKQKKKNLDFLDFLDFLDPPSPPALLSLRRAGEGEGEAEKNPPWGQID